jgi:mRNA interferase RelE/StbE
MASRAVLRRLCHREFGPPLRAISVNETPILVRSRLRLFVSFGGSIFVFFVVNIDGAVNLAMTWPEWPSISSSLRKPSKTWREMKAHVRSAVRVALETHLRHEPERTSRSRIKRLRGLRRPQYRLRVDDARVFYDVSGASVEVLAIVAKSEAESWLEQFAGQE